MQNISTRALIVFFILAYAITWGLSVVGTANVLPFNVPPLVASLSSIFLHYGPALAAILVAGATGGRARIGALFSKLKRWKAAPFWYLVVFFYPVLLRLLTVGIHVLLGGEAPEFLSANGVPGGNPILLLPVIFVVVFFQAGLAEEIGWRGFGLPGLQQRFNALTSSLILGLIWAVWHFHPENFASLWPLSILYVLTTLAFTILLTWVYNNTNGSLLLMILFHTASNVSDWIVPTFSAISDTATSLPFIIQTVLMWVTVLVVVAVYGAKNLSHQAPLQD